MKQVGSGSRTYSYSITSADLKMEQEAFEPGEGVRINKIILYAIINILYLTRKRS